uniref:Uncharacterized protein n=1 Tax=Arundo donax TaxID=35708 RepID=A0A0A9BMC3_ARUDO
MLLGIMLILLSRSFSCVYLYTLLIHFPPIFLFLSLLNCTVGTDPQIFCDVY